MSNQFIDTLDTMHAFADMTGGHAYVNTNDTTGAIRDAAQDGSDYYMLSYAVDKSDRRPGWRKINGESGRLSCARPPRLFPHSRRPIDPKSPPVL